VNTLSLVDKQLQRTHGKLGTVADIVSILAFLGGCWALVSGKGIAQAVLAVALAFLTISCVYIALSTLGQLLAAERAAVDANRERDAVRQQWTALGQVEHALEQITNANVMTARPDDPDAERFTAYLEAACKSIAHAMKDLTGHACRVTLQQTGTAARNGADELIVTRIASSQYDRSSAQEGSDWVSDNTDFLAIAKGSPHFLCNDLPEAVTSGYQNSHWTPDLLAQWKLNGDYPYKSTLVLPVRGPSLRPDNRVRLAGYLSIDAKDDGVFDEDVAGVVGRIVTTVTYASLVQLEAGREDIE